VFYETNPHFEALARQEGFYSKELVEKIAEEGNISKIEEIEERFREIFVTALEVPPEAHIKMQATFQKYVDNAVSKTVNLPSKATVEDVDKIFRLAYELGCKGTTVYRYGSREHQVLSIGKKENIEGDPNATKRRVCPECGSKNVTIHARCNFCRDCGASRCSL
jgi:ribonucleoside-diphosphate reductase alpha chain